MSMQHLLYIMIMLQKPILRLNNPFSFSDRERSCSLNGPLAQLVNSLILANKQRKKKQSRLKKVCGSIAYSHQSVLGIENGIKDFVETKNNYVAGLSASIEVM